MITRQARPSLASQAAKVRIINDINSSFLEENIMMIRVRVNIIASRASRAINRWRR